VPETGGVVVVCNHVSFVDFMIIAGMIRRPTRFVMDHRIAATPGVSLLFRQAKTIPIAPEREDKALMERAFERIAEELRAGELVCIFPEGKLTKDGSMERFRGGIERIIRQTPVPVVPMALEGLWGSMFSRMPAAQKKEQKRGLRFPLKLTIGEPIPPEEVSAASLEERVRALLSKA
jgi:1-acyl-sn-glycerol-3-phosphate acyltransferase